MIQHLLVAVDGSEGSRRWRSPVPGQRPPPGARVTLLHVLEPIPVVSLGFAEFYGVSHRQPTDEEMAKLHQALHEMLEGFPRDRVEEIIEYGTPADTIVAQAEARNADLIVMGARGMGAVGRFLVGSVSDRVVHQARRNVTVVH